MPSFKCKDCGIEIPGTNCAHELSLQFKWIKKPGCEGYCPCFYPIKTIQLREHVFTDYIDGDKTATTNAFIFCESKGGRHVYYGTYSHCEIGNNYTAEQMESKNPLTTYERYASYK